MPALSEFTANGLVGAEQLGSPDDDLRDRRSDALNTYSMHTGFVSKSPRMIAPPRF